MNPRSPRTGPRLLLLALPLMGALSAACGDDEAERRETLRALFPPYRINERPYVEDAPRSRSADTPGAVLVEQIFRSYPQHTSFQLNHELVERQEDPVRTLEIMALTPGMTFGDLGCGSGFFTLPAAELVGPTGRVYAIDIQEAAIRFLTERLEREPALNQNGNIILLHSRVNDTTIPPNSLDVGLFSHSDFYAFHPLLDENVRMLRSVYEAFKPGGRMVVVQYMGLANSEGMTEENIRNNFLAAGFVLELAEFQPPANTWYHAFVKPQE